MTRKIDASTGRNPRALCVQMQAKRLLVFVAVFGMRTLFPISLTLLPNRW